MVTMSFFVFFDRFCNRWIVTCFIWKLGYFLLIYHYCTITTPKRYFMILSLVNMNITDGFTCSTLPFRNVLDWSEPRLNRRCVSSVLWFWDGRCNLYKRHEHNCMLMFNMIMTIYSFCLYLIKKHFRFYRRPFLLTQANKI